MKKKSIVCMITAIIVAIAMIPSTAFAGGTTLTTNFANTSASYANQTVARAPLTVTVSGGTAPYTYKWHGVTTKTYYRDSSDSNTLLATHSRSSGTDSFTPLSKAGTMYYYVVVTDSLGNTSQIYNRETTAPYAKVNITPNPPTGVKVKNLNSFQNYITWAGGSGDMMEYQVYRSCKYYSLKQCSLGTGNTYYKDSCGGMVPGVKYYYKVKSRIRFDGSSAYTYSSSYSTTVAVTYTLPASKITKLSKTSSTSIKIYWSKVSDATGYKIYQKVSGGEWKCIKTITKNTTLNYTKKSLKKGKTYYYKVRAYKTYDGHTGYAAYSAWKSTKL